MKLEDITTVEQAKALAYDQLILQDQAAQNLRALNARIAELNELAQKKDK